MYLKPVKSIFKLGNKTYKIIGKGKRYKRFKCNCGNTDYDTKFGLHPIDGNNEFGSMEVNIIECTECHSLFLEREVFDYDYFYYNPVMEV